MSEEPQYWIVKNWFSLVMLFNKCFLEESVRRMSRRQSIMGKLSEEKPDDTPFSSYLILDFVKNKPIHVVFSYDQKNDTGYIVTAYIPDPQLWTDNFRKRR